MSQINIQLSANTATYVKRLKEAKTQTDRNVIMMEKRIHDFADQVKNDFSSVEGAINTMLGGLNKVKGGGYVLAFAAVGVAAANAASGLHNLAKEAVEAEKVLLLAARNAKASTEEMYKMGIAADSVGVNLEKLGDIGKDVFDRLGDYTTAGAGALVDFFETIPDGSVHFSQLLGKNGIEVIQTMVNEMERAGVSGSQMTFVLESIASDASHLLPLLRNNGAEFKRIQETLAGINATPLMLKSTVDELRVLETAWDSMWNSFGVAAAQKLEGLYDVLGEFFTWVNNQFADLATSDHIDRALGGDIEIDLNKTTEELEHQTKVFEEALKQLEQTVERHTQTIESNKKSGSSYLAGSTVALSNEIALIEKQKEELKTKISELNVLTKLKRESDLSGARSATHESVDARQGTVVGKTPEELEKELKEVLGIVSRSNDLIESKKQELLTKTQELENANSEIVREALESRVKEIEGELKKEEEAYKNHGIRLEDIHKAQAEHQRVAKLNSLRVIAETTEDALEKEKASYSIRLLDIQKRANDEELTVKQKNALIESAEREHQSNIQKITLEDSIKLLDLKAELAKTDLAQLDAKNLATIERIKLRGVTQGLTEEETNNLILKQQQQHEENKTKLQQTAELESARIRSEAAITKAAQLQTAHEADVIALQQRLEAEKLTIDEHNGILFNKEYDFIQQKAALQTESYTNEQEARIDQATQVLEWLNEQRELNRISEEEHDLLSVEHKQAIADAKKNILMSELDMMSDSIAGISSLAKQGSKTQKMLFAAEKAASIAKMIVLMNDNALAAKKAAGSGVQGEVAATASRIKDGAAIAAATATTIGQFHSGTDEVDQTGSYILKAGERIVQETANKDLTSYLKANSEGKGSNSQVVNAPFNVSGDANIDPDKFQQMLYQYRETLASTLKVAQRENPSLR
ncbi:TPA: hypothetical protein PMC50_002514 [Vibrio cholerae]|nr:hypothetical protein [Vibrio cholerae]